MDFLHPSMPVLFPTGGHNYPAAEVAFLQAIIDNPDDNSTRLVFADWLEENNQPVKARIVRLEVELSGLPRSDGRFGAVVEELNRLDETVGDLWSWALMRPARLLNCGGSGEREAEVRFAFQCPNRWTDLKPTRDDSVRHCEQCRKNVYACETKQQAEEHAVRGHCIAVNSRLVVAVEDEVDRRRRQRHKGFGMTLGMPLPAIDVWANDLFARRGKRWWQFWR